MTSIKWARKFDLSRWIQRMNLSEEFPTNSFCSNSTNFQIGKILPDVDWIQPAQFFKAKQNQLKEIRSKTNQNLTDRSNNHLNPTLSPLFKHCSLICAESPFSKRKNLCRRCRFITFSGTRCCWVDAIRILNIRENLKTPKFQDLLRKFELIS